MDVPKPLYLMNPYLKEFEATVTHADRNYVVLDQTAFYPNSGGQPFDKGTMQRLSDRKEFSVVYVGKFGGRISHEVDQLGLAEGDRALCRIDWERRHLFMRYHTACHVLSAVINQETGALITGNQIGEDKTRIDFSLEKFDREQIGSFERKANLLISRGISVRTEFLSREDVEKDPSMVKLAKGMPAEISEFRIVDIEGLDKQACGGTHVKNTKEIGSIRIVNTENKGKNNRRVYFTLG
jgi:misacylated tRNA(Ala) deacylase